MVKYSICTTVYNNAPRIRSSLDSILKYINPEDFEIVVVDSKSTDGTLEILKEYQKRFSNFKIIVEKCKRGRGRQIAFENSKGEFIIQVDLDTVYYPQWWEFIKAYERWDGYGKYAVQAVYSGIYPRHLLEKVGGWRNLQHNEDFDLWWRLIEINAFKWCPLITGENWISYEPEKRQAKNTIHMIWRKFIAERDRYIVRNEIPLKLRFNIVREWASSDLTYYLFWMPLEILAYVAGAPYKKSKKIDMQRKKEIWMRNMIEFPINGPKKYEFAWVAYSAYMDN
ncbi:glycosyl transferase [Aciduliprofundum sp. MAR08-339]|uniref:glycosyltransferase n=1 Tax=Aciduliprofundum sp. (strain MAR08-339) TaxID=673860 RepID=UPI0002A492AF|nr:glycosyl transferase [Aciduliprofundum sp. MAR08-339]